MPRAGAEEFVDLACGPGLITATLAAYGWRVLGVDASRPLVEIARRQLARQPGAQRSDTRRVSAGQHTAERCDTPKMVGEPMRVQPSRARNKPS